MARWERRAEFTFQDIFQRWNDHSKRNKPTLSINSLNEIVEAMEEVVEWFQLGVHLKIPHYELLIIKADYQDVRKCKIEMFRWWLMNSLDAKRSLIVKALVMSKMKALAHRVALDHGVPISDFTDLREAATVVEPPLVTGHVSQQVQNLRERAHEWRANIKTKKENLDQKEEKLHQSQLKKEMLTHEMSDIRTGIESTQSRIEGLLQEKSELEQTLKQKEEEVKTLKVKLSTMGEREQHLTIIAKQQEAARYQKKLDSVRKKLKAERKK